MARAARISEKVVQAHIVALLRSIGGRVYVLGTRRRREDFQGTMQTPGVPDLMAFLPAGRHLVDAGPAVDEDGCAYRRGAHFGPALLFVECKAAGGRLRPEQATFAVLCQNAHVEHLVGDLDVVIAWCVAHGYLKADGVAHYRQPQPAGGPS